MNHVFKFLTTGPGHGHTKFILRPIHGDWYACVINELTDSSCTCSGRTPEDAIAALDLKLREMQQ